jgi:hypothetical protein
MFPKKFYFVKDADEAANKFMDVEDSMNTPATICAEIGKISAERSAANFAGRAIIFY